MIAPSAELRTPEVETGEGPPPITTARPRGGFRAVWRTARAPLAVLAVFVLGVIVVVLLAPAAKSNTYLDPAGTDAEGTKALADILGDRGYHVTSVYSPAAALGAIGSPSGGPAVTLVITRPDLLTAAQREQLAHADADLFLVEPGAVSLATLAPAISVTDQDAPFGSPVDPGCAIAGARLAGSADTGLITYHGPGYATGCYRVDGNPSLVRYVRAGRAITILGSGSLMGNGLLAEDGNAALALNLLNAHRVIVWLTPEPTIARPHPPATSGEQSGPALIPGAAWLVALQLGVALALAAVWRARRFGPLISEQLPVVVRASETVEGHARLYQSRRARDRAAQALRDDMLGRIRPALGLAGDAPADAVAGGLASRSRHSREQILAIVYGPTPGSDADLVRLAADLDELEREVRSQ
jgi:hypothetical protein